MDKVFTVKGRVSFSAQSRGTVERAVSRDGKTRLVLKHDRTVALHVDRPNHSESAEAQYPTIDAARGKFDYYSRMLDLIDA